MDMVLYVNPGGELSADSSPSGTGPTETETDLRRSEGRWAFGATTAAPPGAALIADIEGGMEDRLLRCLYVGEPSMTEYTLLVP